MSYGRYHDKHTLRCLISRTDRLGDVVFALPVASSIKKTFPKSYLGFLCHSYTKDILKNNPFVDEILTIDQPFLRVLRQIKDLKFDVFIVLFPRLRSCLLAWLSGCPVRVSNEAKVYNFLFCNKILFQRRRLSLKNEAEYNLELASFALNSNLVPTFAQIFLTSQEKKQAKIYLKNLGIKEGAPIIGIHPGSGGSARNWPLHLYAKLIDSLSSEKFVVVITYGNADIHLIRKLKSYLNQPVFFLDRLLKLREFIGLVSCMSVFVSNATGPLHIAGALGVPTVGIHCPLRSCSPRRWTPWTLTPSTTITPQNIGECKKCIGRLCRYFDCMEKVTVAEVKSAIMDALDSTHSSIG